MLVEQQSRPLTFGDIWNDAWYWIKQYGLPLEDWILQRIDHMNLPIEEMPAKSSMAYYLSCYFETRGDKHLTDEYKSIVYPYRRQMNELWGWPTWGYKNYD